MWVESWGGDWRWGKNLAVAKYLGNLDIKSGRVGLRNFVGTVLREIYGCDYSRCSDAF